MMIQKHVELCLLVATTKAAKERLNDALARVEETAKDFKDQQSRIEQVREDVLNVEPRDALGASETLRLFEAHHLKAVVAAALECDEPYVKALKSTSKDRKAQDEAYKTACVEAGRELGLLNDDRAKDVEWAFQRVCYNLAVTQHPGPEAVREECRRLDRQFLELQRMHKECEQLGARAEHHLKQVLGLVPLSDQLTGEDYEPVLV